MTVVRFLRPFENFNKSEIAGVSDRVAVELLKNGTAELFEDGVPRETESEPEAATKDEIVVVRFLAGYASFNPGEIGGVTRSTADDLIARKIAKTHGDGKPRDEDPDRGGRPANDDPGVDFDAEQRAWMRDRHPKIKDAVYDNLAAVGVYNANLIVIRGAAWLAVHTKGVRQATAENLVVAAVEYLRANGYDVPDESDDV